MRMLTAFVRCWAVQPACLLARSLRDVFAWAPLSRHFAVALRPRAAEQGGEKEEIGMDRV